MTLVVTRGAWAALTKEAADAHPREACGLLFGQGRIDQAKLCANVHSDPLRYFEIDPADLIAAHKSARAGGPAIAGFWHSHPSGGIVPSPADRGGASGDGRVWAIVAGEEIAFWRDTPGGFEPLSYIVHPS